MTDLALVLVTVVSAPGPRTAVADAVATGLAATHVTAATQQVRQAARDSDFDVVDLNSGCRGRACIDEARAVCDYLLLTTLRSQRGQIEVHVELVDVHSGVVVSESLNTGPLDYGTATLDLPLLVVDVLAAVSAPTRAPPESPRRPEQIVVSAEPTAEEVVPGPVEATEAVPRVRMQEVGFSPPSSEPVPREGIWSGHCVSHPELGADVFLEPDDWKRYRRHRKIARDPLPLRRWIEEQNHESMALNIAWIAPPVILIAGLLADSSEVAVLGGGTMPLAVLAAIFDVADVGSVDECRPARRRRR